MATIERGSGTRSASRVETFGRVVLVVLFTGVETATLAVWLAIVRDAPVVSRTAAVGFGVLAVGLFVEHFLTDGAVNDIDLSFPFGSAVLFSVSEAALWALWLGIAERVGGPEGVLAAGVVLAALLVPQHTLEDNALRGSGLFSEFLDRRTVGFSAVEAAGATVWLLFVLRPDLVGPRLVEFGLVGVDPATLGVGILAAALLVEHGIGVRFSRRS